MENDSTVSLYTGREFVTMKTKIINVLFVCLFFLSFFGFSMSAAKNKKIHPKDMFDHDMHTDNFFAPAKVPCETCHINDQYVWEGMNKDGCHRCHTKLNPIMAATSDCSMCHRNWPVVPSNHKVGWEKTHKTEAKLDPKSCKNCHNDRFCITCHNQRSTIDQVMHKRNYKYFHSVDARANPKKCDRCHQVTYCTRCHSSRRGR